MDRSRKTQYPPHDTHYQEQEALSMDTRKIYRGIVRYSWLIILLAVVGLIAGIWMKSYLSSYYTANSILIYQKENVFDREREYQILHLSLPSALEMVTLPVHIKAVKSILGLNAPIEEIQDMINIEVPAKDSNLITISVTAENKNLAVDIANTLARVVVRSSQNLNREQWQKAYTFFTNQVRLLRLNLDEKVEELADFRQKHRFLGMDIGSSAVLQDLIAYEKQLKEMDLELTRLEVEYANLKEEFQKIPGKIAAPRSEKVAGITQLDQLENALILARTKYAPNNPKIKSLEAQIAEIRSEKEEGKNEPEEREMVTNPVREQLDLNLIEMQAKLQSTSRLKEEVGKRVEKLREDVSNLSQEQLTFAQMLAKKESIEQKIFQNEQKQRNAEIMINLGKGDLELYQTAEKAFSNKNSVGLSLLPIVGLFVGLFAGFTFVLAKEIFEGKVRTAKQCELLFKIPCIFTIPHIRGMTKINGEKKVRYYIRQLAERLQHLKAPLKSLALTSSMSGEGKSFLLSYLSGYYAHIGKKVLLLDLDFRENSFLDPANLPEAKLEHYLKGKCQYREVVAKGKVDRIKLGDDIELSRLLASEAMKELWGNLEREYDFILVDIPGAVEDDFTVEMTRFTEVTLFVIDSSRTGKDFIETSIQEIEAGGTKVDGIVLNNILPVYLENMKIKTHQKLHESEDWSAWFAARKKDIGRKNSPNGLFSGFTAWLKKRKT